MNKLVDNVVDKMLYLPGAMDAANYLRWQYWNFKGKILTGVNVALVDEDQENLLLVKQNYGNAKIRGTLCLPGGAAEGAVAKDLERQIKYGNGIHLPNITEMVNALEREGHRELNEEVGAPLDKDTGLILGELATSIGLQTFSIGMPRPGSSVYSMSFVFGAVAKTNDLLSLAQRVDSREIADVMTMPLDPALYSTDNAQHGIVDFVREFKPYQI